MRWGIRVYGLQHCVNNANQDVHTVLNWWNEFFSRLKHFEALLAIPERRKRFQHTCVRGSALEPQSYKLDNWSQRLYEKRWREVVAFLKRLRVQSLLG